MTSQSILPRFALTNLDDAQASTDITQLAATIYALDVPLHPDNPWTTSAGDGLRKPRVVWNFDQRDPAGNAPGEIMQRWSDTKWLDANPDNPLAVCKRTFDLFFKFKRMIETGGGPGNYHGAACDVTNTRKAAVLAALGHPLIGWRNMPVMTTWRFHQAAAADAALYDDRALYERLPGAAIAYAKAAILGHAEMVNRIKQIQFARVEHSGRVAMIGRDLGGEKLNQLEKILYRK